MDFMDQIIAEVRDLGESNRWRDEEQGTVKQGADITRDINLGMFFDGAEDLNTPDNRAAVHLAYKVAYMGRKS